MFVKLSLFEFFGRVIVTKRLSIARIIWYEYLFCILDSHVPNEPNVLVRLEIQPSHKHLENVDNL